MSDPRVLTLFWVVVVMIVSAGITRFTYVSTERRRGYDRPELVTRIVLIFALMFPNVLAASWADQTLWNMIAPTFGWPQIDLLIAFAIGALISSFVWSTAGFRRVIVWDPKEED